MKLYSRIRYAPFKEQFAGKKTAFATKNSCCRRFIAHEEFPKELPTADDFYAAEIDGLKEYRNGWAWGHCPFHADSNPSFTVNLDTGAFRCMSSCCGVSGSNIVSFVSQRDGLSYREARRFLEDW
ncbi:DNA primase [Rhodocyclaceae bacterium]|nr:DNA primase [Rhodocyclaceae bacterium]